MNSSNKAAASWVSLPANFPASSLTEAVKVVPTNNPKVYTGDLRRDWCIGLVPHGGYIGSVLAYAVEAYMSTNHANLNQPDLISSHIEFLARSAIGPYTLVITVLKLGRQFSNFRIALTQPDSKGVDKVCVEAYMMQGNLAAEAVNGLISLDTKPLLDVVPARAGYRLLPISTKFAAARPAAFKIEHWLPEHCYEQGFDTIEPSIKEQWIRWTPTAAKGAKFTVQDLPYVADCFRPVPESYGVVGSWFPTINFVLDVKRGGEWEWLFIRIHMSEVRNGRFGLDLVIADEDGVVATSRHIALIVSAERNSKGREEKAKI